MVLSSSRNGVATTFLPVRQNDDRLCRLCLFSIARTCGGEIAGAKKAKPTRWLRRVGWLRGQIYLDRRTAKAIALLVDLLWAIRIEGIVEPGPSLQVVGGATFGRIDPI
jgi:hypothetical protein